MMPARAVTADSLPTLRDDLSKIESNMSSPRLAMPYPFERQCSNPIVTALSPPPRSRTTQPQHKKSHLRLRSDSGLALHTNQAAFRHYTDYNSDGPLPIRPCRARGLSFDGHSSIEDFSLSRQPSKELKGFVSNGKVLPDFFEHAVIELVFSNPATIKRLRKFAETRHGESDIDFLLKVEEYSRALENVISSMSYISSHFTGATATSPLGLPLDTASALRSNVKFCARTALPGLDKVYQEAKATAKERLSHNLYPEFVKHQLSQCLTASLVSSCTLTGEARTPYPGLGDAFCLTDPFRPDNPMVFASDGLVAMSGFRRRELVGKNCRLLQGSATDPEAACRLSQALLAGREATELILNYRPDGMPYWNFLFICPLMENGGVRYYLGAQINVSEHMGAECNDILGVLNFGPDPEESHPSRIPSSPELGGWSARQSSENLAPGHPDEHQHGEKHHSRRHRFLRHFHRRTPSSLASSPSPSTASEATTDDTPPSSYPYPPPRSHPPPLSPLLGSPHFEHFHPQLNQHLDEHSTPYARFLVMRYTPTPTSTPAHSYTTTPPSPTPAPSPTTTTTPPSSFSAPSNAPSRARPQTRRLTRARDHPPPLTIAFASTFALTLLGLRPHEAHELVGRDVFSVLAAQLASPSVNRAFRANMMSKMARGEAVGVELMATAAAAAASAASGQGAGAGHGEGGEGLGVRMGGRPHVRGAKSAGAAVGSGSGSGSSLGLGSESEEGGGGGGGRPRLGGAVEKGSGFFSQVLFTGAKGPLRRVVSNWVPLRDGEGKVGWVVLVLTPVE